MTPGDELPQQLAVTRLVSLASASQATQIPRHARQR
jgi:hypothetical protein